MEIAQEASQVLMMDSNIHDHDHGYVNVVVKKRKRTKRQRAPSSPNLVAGITTTTTTTTSTSSSTGGTGAGLNITSSSSDHHQFSESSSEEEDMANCLILLAQGHNHNNNNNNIGSKRPIEEIITGTTAIEKCQLLTEVEAAPTTTFTSTICKQLATTGFDAYECKTCNRCFPSFQALGGHRASHKRPIKALGLIQDQEQKKMTISTSTTSGFLMMEQDETQFINENTIIHPSLTLQMGSNKNNNINSNRILSSSTSTSTSNHHHHHQSNNNNNNNNKSRIHECSICGSEFSSGQALGGHMRRHRSSTITTTTSSTAIMSSSQLETASTNKKSRNNGLSLDLNLPAPEEDHMNKFIFAAKQKQPALVVFSAASLVDCHY